MSYLFHMKAVEKDLGGYYAPWWDLATPITVTAENKDAAFEEATAVMGKLRSGWVWLFRVEKIEPAQVLGVELGEDA